MKHLVVNGVGANVVGIDRYITHFYCLAVEAGFYSDVVECLPLDPAAQVRFPPRAVGIFLHPVTLIPLYSLELRLAICLHK